MKQSISKNHAHIALVSAVSIAIIADRCLTAFATRADEGIMTFLAPVLSKFSALIFLAIFWLLACVIIIAQFAKTVRYTKVKSDARTGVKPITTKHISTVQVEFIVVSVLMIALTIAVIRENINVNLVTDESAIHAVLSIFLVLPALAVLLTQIPTGQVDMFQPHRSFEVWLRGCVIEPFANGRLGLRSLLGDNTRIHDTQTPETIAKRHILSSTREVLVGIAMLIPVLLVLLPLLMEADDMFMFTMQQAVRDIDIMMFVWHAIFILVAVALLFSLFVGVWQRIEQSTLASVMPAAIERAVVAPVTTERAAIPTTPATTAHTAMVMPELPQSVSTKISSVSTKLSSVSTAVMLSGVVALYIAFLAIHIHTVVIGISMGDWGYLPDGLTYAQYARSGFFETAAAGIVNLILFGLVIRYCEVSRMVQCLLIGIIACSFVMTASAAYRLFLYIDTYGMTMLRLEAAAFIPVMAIILVLALMRLYTERVPLIAVCIVLIIIWWIVLGMLHPTEWLYWYNITHGYA